MRKITYKGKLIAIELLGCHFFCDKEAKNLLKNFVKEPSVDFRCQWVSIKRF